MDWQLLGLTFITVFVAEIGDKSLLVTIALSSSSKFPQAVFFGATIALILASVLGVALGIAMGEFLPVKLLKGMAAIGFILIALSNLWQD
jgi:putative Ca2+/H+ antiporter (TMEM165/GDT1 family)